MTQINDYSPFRVIRTNLQMTQERFGRKLDITAQTAHNYELGLIGSPPDFVLNKVTHLITEYLDVPRSEYHKFPLVDYHNAYTIIKVSPLGILDAYTDWKRKRRAYAGRLLLGPNGRPNFHVKTKLGPHPFIAWRERAVGSRRKFCIEFCIPVATLTDFETGWNNMPDWLKDILTNAGMDTEELLQLDSMISKWRGW